jgi:hypothetical protein
MILAMQQMGCSKAGASILGEMLSIAANAFDSQWTKLEEKIGIFQIILGNTILNENIEKEKELSACDNMDRYLLCVSIDAGWNNRGSGKAYNSNSGHHITVGNRTGLVVALHHMSKRCIKCEIGEKQGRENVQDRNVCSPNYHGSSKGMEAHGALQSCLHLHTHHEVVYEIIVMDNDSSTENILKWNFVEVLANKMIDEIPKTDKRYKKVDNGQLPLTHPAILRLADHNHRNRCMAAKFYLLARGPQFKSMLSLADAETLKRNLTYALHQYKGGDFATFKKMIWAVFIITSTFTILAASGVRY